MTSWEVISAFDRMIHHKTIMIWLSLSKHIPCMFLTARQWFCNLIRANRTFTPYAHPLLTVAYHYWYLSSQRRTITFETVLKLEAGCCWIKKVACYMSCPINSHGCIGYICCRNCFPATCVLVWVGNKNVIIFMNSVPKMMVVSNSVS